MADLKIGANSKIGDFYCADEPIELNPGLRCIELTVINRGDRPVQVGSHFHFFEVNRVMDFPREQAFGMRLDIPAGTAMRFEPGEEKKVQLVEYAGEKVAMGFNGLTMGCVTDSKVKEAALLKARELGFKGA